MRTEQITKRNEEIVQAGKDNQNWQEIADFHGVHRNTVAKILKAEGMEPKAQRGRKPLESLAPLGDVHVHVGGLLSRFRFTGQAHELPVAEMAKRLRISTAKYMKAERGSFDFTLTQLSRIANLLEVPIETLVTYVAPVYTATNRRA